ncbi:YopX family protein [Lactiplantibacillus plantarum]|uniref:YopX family protein n=1 Tax=Lactiplantibacillus plantarum TaxID=1590 RepID=UPI000AF44164|nr:YopX family protein [Lactiplantibacillus plantarum]
MIKFRAWNKVDKFMTVPLDIQLGSDGYIYWIEAMGLNGEHDEGDLDVFKLEQFTGLKDMNGKEIYEGDIVQPVISYTKRNIGKPFEVKKGNYVYGKWIAKDVSSKEIGVDGYYFSNEIKAIGNVHTNPDLLKG